MSLMGALNSAVSALAAQSQAISSVSDNLANSSTYGYKTTTTSFEDLVTGGTSTSSDGGVLAQNRTNMTQQGLLTSTSTSTDIAISGNGFFAVQQGLGSSDTLYTRDGEFSVDSEGYLENDGNYLLGWATDASGNIVGNNESASALAPINTEADASTATATSKISIAANLPSDAAVGDTYTSSTEIYDSLGTGSDIEITWTKTASNTWTAAFANPTLASDSSTTSGTVSSGSPVTITFNSDGTLASATPTTLAISGWTDGAADSSISLNLGTAGTADGLTQYSSGETTPSVDVQSITQDGMAYGTLSGITIGTDGAVVASYSNGDTKTIAKIAVATFNNPDGLSSQSGDVYAETQASGTATLQASGVGAAGTVEGGELESSTTDTSEEFSTMISAQQAYSAAAQVMSTVNSMFQTLISDLR
jgi:flagellar hook protein FlgE